MEIFTETLKKLWNLWEIRSLLLLSLSWQTQFNLGLIQNLVLISLSLQIILIVFGSRRKINNSHSWTGKLLNAIVWFTYIYADQWATLALSVMARSEADCGQVSSKATVSLQAFWAPFLLLHLGGPDTITAYSLEDNELWLRHFLGMIVEVGVAFYVLLRFWSSNVLMLLSIPVFITGIVKYAERTWVLWSSSSEQFKDSLGSFSDPDPCNDLFDYEQGNNPNLVMKEDIDGEDHNLVEAYYSYKRLLFLFANQIIDENRYHSYDIIKRKSAEDAFKLVAIELGLIYDVLYTKAAIVYSRIGISLHCICFVSSVSTLVIFSIIIDMHSYSLIDITITYLLLAGAVLLESYAFMVLFSSDWTRLWLIKFKVAKHRQISEPLVDKFWKFSSCLHSCSTSKKRWSESMGQYNLMNSVCKERHQYLTWRNVDIGLQERIFLYLQKIADELHQQEVDSFRQRRDERLSKKGECALNHYGFGHLLVGNEFDQRIIIWHIVTDICYKDEANKLDYNCKISKWLSDYMLYLLLFRPSMLPKGIGEIRYDHTYVDVEGADKLPPSKHGYRAKNGITSNNCHFSLFQQAKNCHSLLVDQAQGLFEQARGLLKQAQGEQAEDLFEQAWDLLKQAQGEQAQGLFMQAQGEQAQGLFMQAQGEQAEGLFEQAKGLYKQAFCLLKQARSEKAQGLFNHEQFEQTPSALYKQAQDLFNQVEDLFKQAYGEQAQGLFEQAKDLYKQAFSLLKQARSEEAQGLFNQAEDLFKQAYGEQAQGLFEPGEIICIGRGTGWKIGWDMISEVWLEMLAYAAQNCEWKEHAQHLRKGGELLTHVSVLMVNFRLNKQMT
ncbi:hypothetical protein Q3G72_031534 [Acer saccharum]|nr:hypothetical protein Q3G72_031534 [Acer saccharum]